MENKRLAKEKPVMVIVKLDSNHGQRTLINNFTIPVTLRIITIIYNIHRIWIHLESCKFLTPKLAPLDLNKL